MGGNNDTINLFLIYRKFCFEIEFSHKRHTQKQAHKGLLCMTAFYFALDLDHGFHKTIHFHHEFIRNLNALAYDLLLLLLLFLPRRLTHFMRSFGIKSFFFRKTTKCTRSYSYNLKLTFHQSSQRTHLRSLSLFVCVCVCHEVSHFSCQPQWNEMKLNFFFQNVTRNEFLSTPWNQCFSHFHLSKWKKVRKN